MYAAGEAVIADDPHARVVTDRDRMQAIFGRSLDQLPRRAAIARHRELSVLTTNPNGVAIYEHVAQSQRARRLLSFEVPRVR